MQFTIFLTISSLIIAVIIYLYLKFLKTHFFIMDLSSIIDDKIIKIVKKIPSNMKIIIPESILISLKNESNSSDIIKAESSRKCLENFEILNTSENIKIKIIKNKTNEILTLENQKNEILNMASKFNCKILTNDIDLYIRATKANIKILNIEDIADIFRTSIKVGDIMTVFIIKKERSEGISYLYDGTKITILNAADYVEEKIACKILKINKDMYEKKILAIFVKVNT